MSKYWDIFFMSIKPFLAFLFLRLLSFTYRFKYLNSDVLDEVKKNSPYQNYLFSLWHQNLIGAILSEMGNKHAVIVSPSKDGELVAKTCEWLGHETARGSSSRGGGSALKKMIKLLRKGIPGAITVDGPRGPAKEPKPGIFELAYLSKTPIVPLTVIPSSYWSFEKSWDKFRVPRPFATFYVHYGKPINVDKTSKDDNFSQTTNELKRLMEQGEHQVNSILNASLIK
ncbi:MAG: DUF374 domain-containing protein [Halobacteriovoraceae bacterium]|nr:DUF374 domain-containing protein [Halobacteriovoraceae bacterium]